MFGKPVRNHRMLFGFVMLAGLSLAVVAAVAIPQLSERERVPGLTFIVVAALLIGSTAAGGVAVQGRYSGVFIDGRGRYSLSRLQMFLWTIVVLSGWSVAIGTNIAAGSIDPADVSIPAELIGLMGISTGTLIGASTIKRINDGKGQLHVNEALAKMDDPLGKQLFRGDINIHKARLSDLIQGESEATKDLVDLGKLQALYFTIVVVAVYSWLVWQVLVPPSAIAATNASDNGQAALSPAARTATAKENPVKRMPAINEAFLAIILLSHGGYLVLKAIPPSKEEEARAVTRTSAAAGHPALADAAANAQPEDTPAGTLGGKG